MQVLREKGSVIPGSWFGGGIKRAMLVEAHCECTDVTCIFLMSQTQTYGCTVRKRDSFYVNLRKKEEKNVIYFPLVVMNRVVVRC